MKTPAFTYWKIDVPPADLPAALAAAGVLWGTSLRAYPFGNDERRLVAALIEAVKGKATVSWREPNFFNERYTTEHMPASFYARIWKNALREQSPVRLEMHFRDALHAPWYCREFADHLDFTRSCYAQFEPASPHVDWNWPVRMGVIPSTEGAAFQSEIQAHIRRVKMWLQPLVSFIDLNQPDAAVDFLFLPAGHHPLESLRSLKFPVRANCIFLLSNDLESSEDRWLEILDAAALAQAKGIIVSSLPAFEAGRWFTELMRELSHNRPLDELLPDVASRMHAPSHAMMLAASPVLLRATVLDTFVRRLIPKLQHREGTVALDERMSWHVGLRGQSQFAPFHHVAQLLEENVGRFRYYQESEEATTISKISEAAAAQMESKPDFRVEQRYLQHRLRRRWDAPWDPPPDIRTLSPHTEYRLTIRIGPKESRWISEGQPFPEHELPPDAEGGHLLTVVFSEPQAVPRPVVRTLFLPAQGPSADCVFDFSTAPEQTWFEGRVIVLHGNRVIQTAMLRLPVGDRQSETSADEEAERGQQPMLGFHSEMAIRPLSAGLNRSGAFTEALILNHSADHVPRATRISGLRASLISLAGLEKSVNAIKHAWDSSDWEDAKKFQDLDAPENAALLRQLAVQGRLLYDALEVDEKVQQPLLQAPRLQVLAAKVDSHLPIEFCYTQRPPGKNARMCPNARVALRNGQCPGTCPAQDSKNSVVCPLAFWGLSRVIEWHGFDVSDRPAMNGADFALQAEPTTRDGKLGPFTSILLGASEIVPADALQALTGEIAKLMRSAPHHAKCWRTWEQIVGKHNPSLLVLMVHVDALSEPQTIELNKDLLDYINDTHVRARNKAPPIVMLLGCGTGVAHIPWQGFAAQFRRQGAAIVVSTIAQLLDVQAPRLAQRLITALAGNPGAGQRSFGEVMLAVKRSCMSDGDPIALTLIAYGDADWWL